MKKQKSSAMFCYSSEKSLGLCNSTVLARVKDRERERGGIEEDRDIEKEREIG